MTTVIRVRSIDSAATAETMRQLRAAIRMAMQTLTVAQAAARAECAEGTILRILRGENVSVRTAARIVEGLGATLEITIRSAPS